MERRSALRFASALTIAAVMAGLTLRLPQRLHLRVPVAAPVSMVAVVASPSPASALVRYSPGIDLAGTGNPVTLPRSKGGKPSPAWKIAYVVTQNPVEIWTANADGTAKQRILRDANTPCWSPDRRKLAFERGGNVWVATADGKRQWQITFWPPNQTAASDDTLHLYGLTWNERDHLISFSRPECFSLTAPDGSTQELWGTTLFHASYLAGAIGRRFPFVESPNARPIDSDDDDKYPNPQNLPTYDLTEQITGYGFTDNSYPAWSRSGKRFAFARNGDLWLAERWEPTADETQTSWYVTRLIACAKYDDGVGYGDHFNVGVTGIAWSPDEKYLSYSLERIDGGSFHEVHVLHPDEPNQDDVEFRPTVHDVRIYGESAPSFSLDGQWILTTNRGQMIAASRDGKRMCNIPIEGEDAVW